MTGQKRGHVSAFKKKVELKLRKALMLDDGFKGKLKPTTSAAFVQVVNSFVLGFFWGWDNFLKVYQSVTEDAVFVSSCIVFPLNLDDSNEHRARFHQGIKVKN